MASWTTPTIFATGDILDVASANVWSNNETFLYQAPYIYAYDSGGTSCGSGGGTQVNLGATYASGYGFSISDNTVVAPIAGVYAVSFTVTFSSGAGTPGGVGYISAGVAGPVNLMGSQVASYTAFPGSSGSGIIPCSAGDSFYVVANNQSGSTLTTLTGSQTYITAVFIGSL